MKSIVTKLNLSFVTCWSKRWTQPHGKKMKRQPKFKISQNWMFIPVCNVTKKYNLSPWMFNDLHVVLSARRFSPGRSLQAVAQQHEKSIRGRAHNCQENRIIVLGKVCEWVSTNSLKCIRFQLTFEGEAPEHISEVPWYVLLLFARRECCELAWGTLKCLEQFHDGLKIYFS